MPAYACCGNLYRRDHHHRVRQPRTVDDRAGNLTIVGSGPFFDNLPGGLSFSFQTDGGATSQIVQVGNGGTGTLNWTAATNYRPMAALG